MEGQCSYRNCKASGDMAAIIFHPIEVLACVEHYSELYGQFLKSRRPRNTNLGQTVSTYTKSDGSTGKLTAGKAWELEHRTISRDGEVINKKTGKPAQY